MKFMQNLVSIGALALMLAHPLTAFGANAAVNASTTPARDLVGKFYAQLEETMKQGDTLGYAGRYKKLEPVIQSSFNLALMTRYAVGSAWSSASVAEQQQLISAFSQFSVATYANRFPRYDGEMFTVLDEKPAPGGGSIVVTHLTPNNEEPVTLNYLVRNDDKGQPRIVDVYLDASISELATRRSEFSGIVKNEGFNALAEKLTQKTKQLGPT